MGTQKEDEELPITERAPGAVDPPKERRRIVRDGVLHVWCAQHKTYFCDCVPSIFDVLGLT